MEFRDNNGIRYLRGNNRAMYVRSIDNFLFLRASGSKPTRRWECIDIKCDAFIITTHGVPEHFYNVHRHSCHDAKINQIEAEKEMKRRVKENPSIACEKIARDVRNAVSKRIKHVMPLSSPSSTTRRMQTYRRSLVPKPPKSFAEINIYGSWELDCFGQSKFLQINDGAGQNYHILGFFTVFGIQKLCQSKRVLGDGTFKVMPEIFRQLYSFHGECEGKYLPYAYFLLSDKSEEIYSRMIYLFKEKARELGYDFSPKYFHVDYEMAMINAVVENIPSVQIQGCFFHYTQCLWSKVQKYGIQSDYKSKPEIKMWIRRFSALPFLPLSEIDDAFHHLHENWPEELGESRAEKFLNYMTKTWICDVDGLFKRPWWNHHYNDDGPRTTNNVEGWHRKLNSYCGNARQTLYPFINSLQDFELDSQTKFADSICKPQPKRPNQIEIDNKILDAKLEFRCGRITALELLDKIGAVVKLGKVQKSQDE